jgi:hypothetical protein
MQQRSKQRTADARQQQTQEQLEQRQQLEQSIKQLKERGLQLLRAGLAAVPASSSAAPAAAPGLQKVVNNAAPQALSADVVAAEIASRAERLKARLAAASLLVEEAAVLSAAGADASTAEECSEAMHDAGLGCGVASSSSDAASLSSDEDSSDEAAALQEQHKCSTARGLQEPQINSSAAADETTTSGSDSSMDSDLENLIAGMLKPSLLPDWTRTVESASFNKGGGSTALGGSEEEDEVFTSMFKVSLPPGL